MNQSKLDARINRARAKDAADKLAQDHGEIAKDLARQKLWNDFITALASKLPADLAIYCDLAFQSNEVSDILDSRIVIQCNIPDMAPIGLLFESASNNHRLPGGFHLNSIGVYLASHDCHGEIKFKSGGGMQWFKTDENAIDHALLHAQAEMKNARQKSAEIKERLYEEAYAEDQRFDDRKAKSQATGQSAPAAPTTEERLLEVFRDFVHENTNV